MLSRPNRSRRTLPRVQISHLDALRRSDFSDLINDLFASVLQRTQSLVDALALNDEHHPDAAVERARHLARRDVPPAHERPKDARDLPRARVDEGTQAARQDARDVLDEAAARDVRHALDERGARAEEREERARVDARRREERAAERRRGVPRARRGVGLRGAREGLAHEREAVGVQARGRQAEQDVAGADGGEGQDQVALDGADGEACEVVVACARAGASVWLLCIVSEERAHLRGTSLASRPSRPR